MQKDGRRGVRCAYLCIPWYLQKLPYESGSLICVRILCVCWTTSSKMVNGSDCGWPEYAMRFLFDKCYAKCGNTLCSVCGYAALANVRKWDPELGVGVV